MSSVVGPLCCDVHTRDHTRDSGSPMQEEQSKVHCLGQETEDRRRGRAVDIITSICSIIGFGLKVLFQSRARFLAWTHG